MLYLLLFVAGVFLAYWMIVWRGSAGQSNKNSGALPASAKSSESWTTSKKSKQTDSGTIEFSYVDAIGQETRRKAKILSVERYGASGHLHLNAYCLLRGDIRQFRTDRMSDPVDLETGEIIDDVEVWALSQGLEMENLLDD